VGLIKEKAVFTNEFSALGNFFFKDPENFDTEVIKKKWNDDAKKFFEEVINNFEKLSDFSALETEKTFKETAATLNLNPGQFMQLFRVVLSGLAGGPVLFEMVELLGKEKVIQRVEKAIKTF
jgi:glutamyl-tRNA synthetase